MATEAAENVLPMTKMTAVDREARRLAALARYDILDTPAEVARGFRLIFWAIACRWQRSVRLARLPIGL